MQDKKNYNTTDLSPDKAMERHVYHRDIFAPLVPKQSRNVLWKLQIKKHQ